MKRSLSERLLLGTLRLFRKIAQLIKGDPSS